MEYGLDIDSKILELGNEAEKELKDIFKKYDDICMFNSAKVLKAFQDNMVTGSDFNEVTGYGDYDPGRDKLEKIYAQIFKAEDALVRPQIMSGSHALYLTFSGILQYGDTLISISGEPYDSLQEIIGLVENNKHSLINSGVKYEQIDLIDNDFDYKAIKERLAKCDVKMVEIQRSRGYSQRNSICIDKIEKVIKVIREVNKDVIIMVDNCYGDLVEKRDPIEVGADLIVSSLMKNLGGGIAKTGGYIVGRKDLVNEVAERLSCPGLGKSLGANFNINIDFYKGLYFAPFVTINALKTMTYSSYILEKLGYETTPKWNEPRTDIIQAITLHSYDKMVKFCSGLQKSCPVESYVTPMPFKDDGYQDEVIMASGSFTPGSTIELSCDGPLKEPYTLFMQGGLSFEYGKLGILSALTKMEEK